jgi:putative membrane protein
MPLSKISHVSEADHQLVTAAVSAAEVQTSGEIVTIVTDLSDDYHDVALLWASAVALLALGAVALMPAMSTSLINWFSGGWRHDYRPGEYLGLLALFVALKWIGTYLILQWMPLRLTLTPRFVKQRRVRARAIDLFRVGTDARTVGRTGVLLYLSMREHRAEIVADQAISGKVSADVWGAAMAALIANVRAGRPGEGMAEAVQQMGIVLADHFPKGSENPNELPDRLIEL